MGRLISRAALVAAALVLAGAAAFAWYALREMPLARSPIEFDIATGSSLRAAAQQMHRAGVLDHPLLFELLTRLFREETNIKAGNYEVEAPVSAYELMRKITRGDYAMLAITLVEGWSFRQVRRALEEHPGLRQDSRGLTEAEIVERLGISAPSAEGWFFPDTYYFSRGISDFNILRRSHQLMRKHLAEQWEARAPGLPLANSYDALILASIIEKETGQPHERPLVSAVFINRLRIGMRLQTDPTVIYGLGERFDGTLRRLHLNTDGPYNTYTRHGMPPTPIAMPGLASIRAALNPAETDALYFVARGDGTSHFSRTLEEHDRAVTRYQRGGSRR
jgi:UPF0755 protein